MIAPMGPLAYDYPLLGFFWTLLLLDLFVVFIVALFHVFADIFRSHDMSGIAKACWFIFVIVLPLVGVIIYVIARGDKMTGHWGWRSTRRWERGNPSSTYQDLAP
jgi:hypothetical protein